MDFPSFNKQEVYPSLTLKKMVDLSSEIIRPHWDVQRRKHVVLVGENVDDQLRKQISSFSCKQLQITLGSSQDCTGG